jgi:exonuclease SbcC
VAASATFDALSSQEREGLRSNSDEATLATLPGITHAKRIGIGRRHRLAPDEPFVPAFALPETTTGQVEAILETHYRSGGKGGNPRAMLQVPSHFG